jgi:hypothetical protein
VAAEPRGLGAALVPGFLQDRRDLRVRDEALPTVGIPVEEHPDPVGLIGIAKDGRAPGTVLRSLLGAIGREDVQEEASSVDGGHVRLVMALAGGRGELVQPCGLLRAQLDTVGCRVLLDAGNSLGARDGRDIVALCE